MLDPKEKKYGVTMFFHGAHQGEKKHWAQTGIWKFHFNIRKNIFTVSMTKCWNRLPGKIVESVSLEIFKSSYDISGQRTLGGPA